MKKPRVWVCMGLVGAAMAVALGGCGAYKLQGRVVKGDTTYVAIVDGDDPRLDEGAGLSGAEIRVQANPLRLNRKDIGRGVSDGQGAFAIELDEFGAGFLEIDAGVSARRKGYEAAEHFFDLPGSGKRVLIVMSPGDPGPEWAEDEDLMKQYERFRE